MAVTKTPTMTALKSIFEQTNVYYLALSISWSMKTCISLHLKSIALEKPFFPFTSKIITLLWTVIATVKRLMVLVLYFSPALGLFNLLHHWQYEQIPFTVRKHKNVTLNDVLVLRDIDPMPWVKLDRWNYYEDPKNPSPPSYTLYTVYSSGCYFNAFWLILALHTGSIIALKLLTSVRFRSEASVLDMFIHGLENCNLPFPWKDWDEDAVTIEDHLCQLKSVNWEMLMTISVNSIFSVVMLLPIIFTGN